MSLRRSAPVVRRRLPATLFVVVASIALATCGGGPGAETAPPIGPAPTPGAVVEPSEDISSPLIGQVVKIDTEGLTKVRGFVLRTDDGTEVPFTIGVLENGAVFPPSHLAEHMATGTAVRISFRAEDGALVAYRIEDAPEP